MCFDQADKIGGGMDWTWFQSPLHRGMCFDVQAFFVAKMQSI